MAAGVAATLLDLAARRLVTIEDRGDGRSVCRLEDDTRAATGPIPYETQVPGDAGAGVAPPADADVPAPSP